MEVEDQPMDAFLSDMDFGSLSIDPINYDIPVSALMTDNAGNGNKFSLPNWAAFPGPTNGVVLHEIRDGKTFTTHDLDLPSKQYYLFGRSPCCPCENGSNMMIKSPNVSRQHFAIVHSKYEALYLIDLGSIHGTFLSGKRIQSYHPIQLHNGNCIAVGGTSKAKYVVRVFPKKPGLVTPFSSFSRTDYLTDECNKEVEEEFDSETTFHTHMNQVPDLPSPKGKHLVKPSSYYSFAPTAPASPIPRSPTSSENAEKAHNVMFRSFSTFNIPNGPVKGTRRVPSASSLHISQESSDIKEYTKQKEEVNTQDDEVVDVEKIDLSKPIRLGSFLLEKKPSGILKKKNSTRRFNSMRKVSFGEMSVPSPLKSRMTGRSGLVSTKSNLHIVADSRSSLGKEDDFGITMEGVPLQRIDSVGSFDSDAGEVDEAMEFDADRDLPEWKTSPKQKKLQTDSPVSLLDVKGFHLDLNAIHSPTGSTVSSSKGLKSDILRTYSVQDLKRRMNDDDLDLNLGFSNLRADQTTGEGMSITEELSFARPGQGFEVNSPLRKKSKSFHFGKS